MTRYSTPTARWAAVSSRDRGADTHFVYGVRTTKVYCRPICPARLPRRANVDFFDEPAQALQAGYRACKRCKPETVIHFEVVDDQGMKRKAGIHRAVQLMKDRTGVLSLEEAAKVAQIGGKWHFLRVFKEVMGETPGSMMARLRKAQTTDGQGTNPIITSKSGETNWFDDAAVDSLDLCSTPIGDFCPIANSDLLAASLESMSLPILPPIDTDVSLLPALSADAMDPLFTTFEMDEQLFDVWEDGLLELSQADLQQHLLTT